MLKFIHFLKGSEKGKGIGTVRKNRKRVRMMLWYLNMYNQILILLLTSIVLSTESTTMREQVSLPAPMKKEKYREHRKCRRAGPEAAF